MKPEVQTLPFPDSLCHRCAAPPRVIDTGSSRFIFCPLRADKYPRQPVMECAEYLPLRPDGTPPVRDRDP